MGHIKGLSTVLCVTAIWRLGWNQPTSSLLMMMMGTRWWLRKPTGCGLWKLFNACHTVHLLGFSTETELCPRGCLGVGRGRLRPVEVHRVTCVLHIAALSQREARWDLQTRREKNISEESFKTRAWQIKGSGRDYFPPNQKASWWTICWIVVKQPKVGGVFFGHRCCSWCRNII